MDESNFTNAQLGAREFSLIAYNKDKLIDLILDTGTVSNLVPEDSRDLLKNIHSEEVTLIGVGGAQVAANETGTTGIFGKARIVPGTGAICVSQRQFGNDFQMLNPHKDIVIVRGWPGTKYANREFIFERDERDQLLHCKLKSKSELALVAKSTSFYQPDELPGGQIETQAHSDLLMAIGRMHEYYNHASLNEMKRMASKWFKNQTVTTGDIEDWYRIEGKHCTGCAEGKLKEHSRKSSTKPLKAEEPGETGVADLMFV